MIRLIFTFALANLRQWGRRPIESFISVMLAILFLLIANQAFTVWLGDQVRVGLHARDPARQQPLRLELERLNLQVIRYDDEAAGAAAVRTGQLSAFLSVNGLDPVRLRVVLGGRNPVLDRELFGELSRIAQRLIQRETPALRIAVENDVYSATALTAFITAGMMAFFVFTLCHTHVGSFWVRDWERGTIFTLLASPASRLGLVLGRLLAGSLLILLCLGLGLLCCQPLVGWPWPPRLLPWAGVVLLQMFMGCGFFFALAALCRNYRFYINICSFLTVVLMFISGAINPVEIMPDYQRIAAHLTPTFHAVRSMRAVMLGTTPLLPFDLWMLAAWGTATHLLGYLALVRTTIRK